MIRERKPSPSTRKRVFSAAFGAALLAGGCDSPSAAGSAQVAAPRQAVAKAPAAVPPAGASLQSSVLEVESYQGGRCAMLYYRHGSGERRRLLDSCRGWAVEDCGGLLLATAPGVRVDTAVAAVRGRVVQVPDLVHAAIGRRFGAGQSYLHLDFAAPACRGGRLSLPFQGSYMGVDAEGSASGMRGTVSFEPDGEATVSVEARD